MICHGVRQWLNEGHLDKAVEGLIRRAGSNIRYSQWSNQVSTALLIDELFKKFKGVCPVCLGMFTDVGLFWSEIMPF